MRTGRWINRAKRITRRGCTTPPEGHTAPDAPRPSMTLTGRGPGMCSVTAMRPAQNRAVPDTDDQRCRSAGLLALWRRADPSHPHSITDVVGDGCERRLNSISAGESLCGAPRRNRTGDPILTMEPPGTAVRKLVSAGRARPSVPKLSVLFRRSYAFSGHLPIVPGAQHDRSWSHSPDRDGPVVRQPDPWSSRPSGAIQQVLDLLAARWTKRVVANSNFLAAGPPSSKMSVPCRSVGRMSS